MDPMPERETPPEDEGAGELVNMSQLAAALGVTRQWLYALRTKDPAFPQPKRQPGSTRDLFELREARTYYRARELRPGERNDLKSSPPADPPDQGD